jgi:hypothetical protein
MPRHFRKCLGFLQMPRQLGKFLKCLGISGIAWHFRKCLISANACDISNSKTILVTS